MQELIKISQSQISENTVETVNARDLHMFLESKQDFSTWMKRRIEEYSFLENTDFVRFHNKMEANNATQIDYFLTLDMAKELSMVERNDKGKQARQYFIECEKRAKQQPVFNIPDNLPDALRLAAELGDRACKAETALIEAAPKTEFFDKFCNADGLYGLQNAGRALECRPNLFIRWLKSKYLFYQGGNLVPRVQFIQNGRFEVKTTIVDDKVRPQTYITPKGLKKLADCIPDEIKLRGVA